MLNSVYTCSSDRNSPKNIELVVGSGCKLTGRCGKNRVATTVDRIPDQRRAAVVLPTRPRCEAVSDGFDEYPHLSLEALGQFFGVKMGDQTPNFPTYLGIMFLGIYPDVVEGFSNKAKLNCPLPGNLQAFLFYVTTPLWRQAHASPMMLGDFLCCNFNVATPPTDTKSFCYISPQQVPNQVASSAGVR